MTKKEAVQLENELKEYMLTKACFINGDTDVVNKIVDDYIEIYPDYINPMGMFHLGKMGESSKSVRLGNVLVNQKALLGALVDLALSVGAPDNWYSYCTFVLAGLVFIGKMVTKEIGEVESYVVAYLHMLDMYSNGKEENEFYEVFPKWFEEKTGDTLSEQRLHIALDKLLKMGSIEIENGEIHLKEKVWKNYLTE